MTTIDLEKLQHVSGGLFGTLGVVATAIRQELFPPRTDGKTFDDDVREFGRGMLNRH